MHHPLPFYEDLQGGPLAIAHRGGDAANTFDTDGNPVDKQNSLAAFESAQRVGIRYGETDAVSTLDGVVLAFHGSRNAIQEKRTALPTRDDIQNMTFDEVRRKVRIGGELMPSMEELLMTFPDMHFFIDPKTDEVVEPLARLINKLGVYDRVSIGSFSYKRTKGVIDLIKTNKVVATTVGPFGGAMLLGLPGFKSYLRSSGVTGFALPYIVVRPHMIEIAKDLGMPIFVWTPNDPDSINKSLDIGVDGVMSDKTQLVYDAVNSKRNSG